MIKADVETLNTIETRGGLTSKSNIKTLPSFRDPAGQAPIMLDVLEVVARRRGGTVARGICKTGQARIVFDVFELMAQNFGRTVARGPAGHAQYPCP